MKQRHPIATMVLLAAVGGLLAQGGCSSPGWGGRPRSDTVAGLTPPYERIDDLREQRKRAARMSPTEAEQLALRLAPQCGQEGDPAIRAEMVLTLGALGSPSARQTLLAAAQDPASEVRVAVCEAWGSIGDEAAATELARILSSDVDPQVRAAATRALGETSSPQAVAALGSALEDRDPAMQYLAMESLKKSTGKDFGHDARLWQQYVQGQVPTREEKSIAQKALDLF